MTLSELLNDFIEFYRTYAYEYALGLKPIPTRQHTLQRINSGDCGTAALAVGAVFNFKNEDYVVFRDNFNHAYLKYDEKYYDTQFPEGTGEELRLTNAEMEDCVFQDISYSEMFKRYILKDQVGAQLIATFCLRHQVLIPEEAMRLIETCAIDDPEYDTWINIIYNRQLPVQYTPPIVPKDTVVVAYQDIHYVSNHEILGPVVDFPDLNTRAVIHYAPRVVVVASKRHTNYDLLLSGTPDDKADYVFKRLSKLEQQIQLQELIEQDTSSKCRVHSIPTYTPLTSSQMLRCDHSVMLIKTMDGARGIGQLLVKETEGISIHAGISKVLSILAKEIPLNQKRNQLIRLIGLHQNQYTFILGNEQKEHEGIDGMIEEGVLIQPCLSNIIAEYRVLTNSDSKVAYIQQRYRKSIYKEEGDTVPIYQQATGSVPLDGFQIDLPHLPYVEQFIERMGIPMHSIDLGLLADGRIVIFEYQPQYAYQGVSIELVYDLHYHFLRKVVKNYKESLCQS